jgi:uncharacterized protein (DUF2062 family)
MILGSREQRSRAKAFRRLFRPQKGHRRTLKYWAKRFLRIRATPHALALGAAIGVFAAFSPALGAHFLFALSLAFLLGGNLVAAGLGTAAANPLTFPLMIAGDYEIGHLLVGGTHQQLPFNEVMAQLTHLEFSGMWDQVFKPLFAGSLVLGTIFALAVYGIIYFAAKAYESAKDEQRASRTVMLP